MLIVRGDGDNYDMRYGWGDTCTYTKKMMNDYDACCNNYSQQSEDTFATYKNVIRADDDKESVVMRWRAKVKKVVYRCCNK